MNSYVCNGAAKKEAAVEEKERGSSVKYVSIPFYDSENNPPYHLISYSRLPPSCTLRASFQSSFTSDTSTGSWNKYNTLVYFCVSVSTGHHSSIHTVFPPVCGPVLFWQGLLHGWLSLEKIQISVCVAHLSTKRYHINTDLP